jgi:mxaJ protein
LQGEIVGFNTIGEGAESIVRAVAEQQVDLAIVWGPLAGYFAKKYEPNLEITPVEPEVDSTGVPFTFAISMGVSKNNVGLRDELEKVLMQKKSEIRGVLDAYGVPRLPFISAQTTERSSARTFERTSD